MKREETVFVLDGSRFDDLEGFYDEVSRELIEVWDTPTTLSRARALFP